MSSVSSDAHGVTLPDVLSLAQVPHLVGLLQVRYQPSSS